MANPPDIPVPNVRRNLWCTGRTDNNNFVDIYASLKRQIVRQRNQRAARYHGIRTRKAPLNRFNNETENPEYPGMSVLIWFDESPEGRGRSAYATHDVGPCHTIGAAKAFASVVDRTDEPYCLTCHELQYTYVACNCQNAIFCDNGECQPGNRTHEFECGSDFHTMKFDEDLIIKCAIQMVFESIVSFRQFQGNTRSDEECLEALINSVRALLHGRRNFQHPVPGCTDTGQLQFECIMQLQGRAEDLERRTKLAYAIIMKMPRIANIFYQLQHRIFLQHLLMHFLMILRENSFETILTRDIKKCSIFDTLSLFNHSCTPNLIKIMHGTKMYLVSSRFIVAGDELCIDYKDFSTEDTQERREILNHIWGFHCKCERCVYADNHQRSNEITERNIIAETSRGADPKIRFFNMDGKLKRRLRNALQWNIKVGALGIAYKNAIVEHLHFA